MNPVVLNFKSGAHLNQIIELAEKLNADVMPITPEDLEEIEDKILLRRMEKSLASGLADREEMLKLLGL